MSWSSTRSTLLQCEEEVQQGLNYLQIYVPVCNFESQKEREGGRRTGLMRETGSLRYDPV